MASCVCDRHSRYKAYADAGGAPTASAPTATSSVCGAAKTATGNASGAARTPSTPPSSTRSLPSPSASTAPATSIAASRPECAAEAGTLGGLLVPAAGSRSERGPVLGRSYRHPHTPLVVQVGVELGTLRGVEQADPPLFSRLVAADWFTPSPFTIVLAAPGRAGRDWVISR